MALKIIAIPALKDNYIWAIINTDNKTLAVVDPGDAKPVMDYIKKNGLILSAIFITHHHWDHTNGIDGLRKIYHPIVYAPLKDRVTHATEAVSEGTKISMTKNFTLTVMEIPGHTLGHVAYVGEKIVFTGDTLFSSGCGRLFEGTAEQMFTSLERLKSLPAATKVYCGHEYTLKNLQFAHAVEPTNTFIVKRIAEVKALRAQPSLPSTIKIEKQCNPFFRCEIPDVIHRAEKHCGKKLATPLAVFAELRRWKDKF